MKKVPLAPDVDPRIIARGTPGFSGADLANLVNEAALLAARRGKRLVAMKEFEHAKDKVMMGAERKSMVMTEDEKKMTAYHEAGHAIVAIHEAARTRSTRRRSSRAAARSAWSCACPSATVIPITATRCTRTSRSRWAAASPRRSSSAMTRCPRAHPPTSSRRPSWRATWSRDGACRTRSGRSNMPRPTGKPSSATRQPRAAHVEGDRPADRQGDPKRRRGRRRRAPSISSPSISTSSKRSPALLEYETLTGEEIKKVLAGRSDRSRRRDRPGDPRRGSSIPKPAAQARRYRWPGGGRRRLNRVALLRQ